MVTPLAIYFIALNEYVEFVLIYRPHPVIHHQRSSQGTVIRTKNYFDNFVKNIFITKFKVTFHFIALNYLEMR